MDKLIAAANLSAQLHYRGSGNPYSVLPRTAISNCFPGLEFDFRNLWRRALQGIVLIENNNLVLQSEAPEYDHLVGRRLLAINGLPTMVVTEGPTRPGGASQRLGSTANPNAVSFMEWSNSLARLWDKQGEMVDCTFTSYTPADAEVIASEQKEVLTVQLVLRRFFEGNSAAISRELLEPGDLTHGLCAPWQNDYRECACYYWAASRPDYVNVAPGANGLSHGDMWMAKQRSGSYVPDNRVDKRLWSYDDLFREWEQALQFVVGGNDAESS